MWDGSAVPLAGNLSIAAELLDACVRARTVMEMEIGVVGGEEDGIVGEINEKLYSTTDDALATAEALGLGERAATSWPPPSATCTASTSRVT
jgi:fructose-bisphosphate aldolase class II